METPSIERGAPLLDFCRELALLRRQCGRPTLDALSRLPNSRRKSQLSTLFSGKISVPPDRDLVVELVSAFLRRATDRGLTLSLPTTVREWLDRYDAMVQQWEEDHLEAAPERDIGTPLRPSMVPTTSGFVGRTAELAELDRIWSETAGTTPRPVVITALAGTAGVGKTALAQYWAALARRSFPDGILYVNLRGFHAKGRLQPNAAAAILLKELGVEQRRMPHSLARRMTLLNRILTGRAILLILDNAADSAHVRPLLPMQQTCLTIVTSRDSMQDLVIHNDAIRIEVDRLTLSQSVELLQTHLRADVAVTSNELIELAHKCVRLPLALRIAAETMNKFAKRPVAALLNDLGDEQLRLSVFDTRESDHALRTVFSWSYTYLTDEEAMAFRALGLHPGVGNVDAYSMAAALAIRRDLAQRRLDMLCRSYLIENDDGGRYSAHDLLRTYAAELSSKVDPLQWRRSAYNRLSRYYLYTTAQAMDVIAPYEVNRRPTISRPRLDVPSFATPDDARRWLVIERENLIAMASRNLADRPSEYIIALSLLIFRFLDSQALYDEAVQLHSNAVRVLRKRSDLRRLGLALRHLGVTKERMGHLQAAAETMAEALELTRGTDDVLVCYILNSLGLIYYRIGRNVDAISLLSEAIAFAERLDDDELLGTAYRNIAIVYWRVGQYQKGSTAIKKANDIAQRLGDDTLFGFTLTNLGLTYWRAGRHEEALQCQRDALEAARRAGSEVVTGYALTNYGLLCWRMGDYAMSRELQEKAFVVANRINHLSLRAGVLMNLALSCWRTDETQQALDLLTQSVSLARQIGDTGLLAEASNSLGEVARSAGHRDIARRSHEAALRVSLETGDRLEHARALEGIGMCLHESGNIKEPLDPLGRSYTIYSELGDSHAHLLAETLQRLTSEARHAESSRRQCE